MKQGLQLKQPEGFRLARRQGVLVSGSASSLQPMLCQRTHLVAFVTYKCMDNMEHASTKKKLEMSFLCYGRRIPFCQERQNGRTAKRYLAKRYFAQTIRTGKTVFFYHNIFIPSFQQPVPTSILSHMNRMLSQTLPSLPTESPLERPDRYTSKGKTLWHQH